MKHRVCAISIYFHPLVSAARFPLYHFVSRKFVQVKVWTSHVMYQDLHRDTYGFKPIISQRLLRGGSGFSRVRLRGRFCLLDEDEAVVQALTCADLVFDMIKGSAKKVYGSCCIVYFRCAIRSLKCEEHPAFTDERQTVFTEGAHVGNGAGNAEIELISVFHPSGQFLRPAVDGSHVCDPALHA